MIYYKTIDYEPFYPIVGASISAECLSFPLLSLTFKKHVCVTIRELVRMRMRFSVNEDRTPLNFIALYWFGVTDENPVTKQVTFNNDSCHRCAMHMMSEPT